MGNLSTSTSMPRLPLEMMMPSASSRMDWKRAKPFWLSTFAMIFAFESPRESRVCLA